jgi:hypothetical protein
MQSTSPAPTPFASDWTTRADTKMIALNLAINAEAQCQKPVHSENIQPKSMPCLRSDVKMYPHGYGVSVAAVTSLGKAAEWRDGWFFRRKSQWWKEAKRTGVLGCQMVIITSSVTCYECIHSRPEVCQAHTCAHVILFPPFFVDFGY